MTILRCNFCDCEIRLGDICNLQYGKVKCQYCCIVERNWDREQKEIREKEALKNMIMSRFEILDIR